MCFSKINVCVENGLRIMSFCAKKNRHMGFGVFTCIDICIGESTALTGKYTETLGSTVDLNIPPAGVTSNTSIRVRSNPLPSPYWK